MKTLRFPSELINGEYSSTSATIQHNGIPEFYIDGYSCTKELYLWILGQNKNYSREYLLSMKNDIVYLWSIYYEI